MSLLNFDSSGPAPKGNKRNVKIVFGIGVLAGVIALGSTLAASINLNSGTPVEFGQGVAQTIACDNGILVTPFANFVNETGSGSFYFSRITLTNLDTSISGCVDKVFTIKLYGDSGSILATYSITYRENSVTSEDGNITSSGIGTTTSSVTLAIEASGISASEVYRITIESAIAPVVPPVPGTYEIGDTGPAGGKIFYYDEEGFNCGPTFSATGSPTGGKCHYLEVAPNGWFGTVEDPRMAWAIGSWNVDSIPGATDSAIGSGFKNSIAIINTIAGNYESFAAGIARSYQNTTGNEWYLPSINELIELHANKVPAGISGFSFWSSTEHDNTTAKDLGDSSSPGNGGKATTTPVRPIRAF